MVISTEDVENDLRYLKVNEMDVIKKVSELSLSG
jgi:hypothetical protein